MADLFRNFDCIVEAEFLYARVARAVEHDLPDEIEFLRRQDEAQGCIMAVAEMPGHLVLYLLMFMRQNGGRIAKRRREHEFAALTDQEAAQIDRR